MESQNATDSLEQGVARDLYDMGVNDHIQPEPNMIIRRVPGGWTYEYFNHTRDATIITAAVFVPFNDEFEEPPVPVLEKVRGTEDDEGVIREF